MKKPIIFLDFDGLKFSTTQHHVEYLNKRYGIKSIAEDYAGNPDIDTVIRKYLPDLVITADDAYIDITKHLLESIELHLDVPPIEGMVEVLPLLAEKFTLWTVTARPLSGAHVVRHLLDMHVPGCIHDCHFVWKNTVGSKWEGFLKRDFMLSIPGEKIAFIDDSPKEIFRTQDIIPSYLFDPTGENDSLANIQYRVRSWKEIAETFL